MRSVTILAAAFAAIALSLPAFADEMSMMKPGEVMAVMPDGHMGTMMMKDSKMSAEMMKMAKPLGHCVMMMTDAKGMAFMVDTSSKMGMAECEKMAK
jgi:hypothetical protein